MRSTRLQLFACLVAALFGAGLSTVWWNTAPHGPAVQAQEQPRFPAQPPPQQPPPTTRMPPLPERTAEGARPPLPVAQSQINDGGDELTPEERVNVAVYEACNRSVVNIDTEATATNLFLLDVVQEGKGSGSVLDKQGHILTNYHVVEGAKVIQVTLFDSKSYQAKMIAKDASTDVAILKIDAPADSLYPVRFGDSTRLKVGQRVFAIGNPFGLERTLTTGVISSLNRSLPVKADRSKTFIQIDAAINPGNSGGPLLDSHGRLIGMNTAIASKTGQNTGVGFAMPVSLIARVAPELIATGHITRPDTGIAKVYETDKGLLIATLQPGGPAETAGLRGFKIVKERKKQGPFTYETQSIDRTAADTVVAVNGKPTITADAFVAAIDAFHPGEEVTITVLRDGKETPVRLKLAAGES
ncbi:MAG TPA: trypsin-like peptidase domain-containing protein [Pirellulales bacterium]|jgi:S1-C subfamily serine protease